MALGTVTVGGDTSSIYGTQAGATSWLNLSDEYAPIWASANVATTQRRALASAYRYLAGLPWRAGVIPDEVEDIVRASYELAAFRIQNPSGMGGPSGGAVGQGVVREVQDTTRRVSFGYSTVAQSARTSPVSALPRDILARIRPYLTKTSHPSGIGLPVATGTDGLSEFSEEKKFTLDD